MKRTATTKPLTVETSFNTFRQKSHIINFDVVELEDGSYEFESIEIAPGQFNYDSIVDALVSSRYPSSKMEAIVNNYLAISLREPDPELDSVITEEMRQMQSWRTKSKEIARQALEK